MIHFTVIESQFIKQIGEKKFFSSPIFFSTSEFQIRKSPNNLSELSFEINSNNQWLLRPLSTTSITINNQSVSSPVLLNNNDLIILGDLLKIKINELQFIPEKNFNQFSEQALDFFKQKDNKLMTIIKKISNEL